MKELIHHIDKLSEFGLNPNVNSNHKIKDLKKYLVEIYNIYLNLGIIELKEDDYEEDFKISYDEIRKNVSKNFPDIGFYISVSNIHELNYEKGNDMPIINSGLGDAIDDISDITLDMLEVKWRFENTSKKDAIWHFDFLMKYHSESHLIELLKYLKDKEG